MRIYFATDVHGSETCWRKFINSARFYEADVLILGGDMTGKAVVPIIGNGDGHYRTYLQDQRHDFDGSSELTRYEKLIRERGYYPIRMTDEELAEYQHHPEQLDDLFQQAMRRTVEEWVALADERLAGENIQCIVCPGNDDQTDIDEILANAAWLQVGEGNVIDLPGDYQLVSTGWSNRTPWDTHREEDEPQLRARIERAVAEATVAAERLVLSLHCPPYDTALDVAPKISADLMVQGQEVAHVGSTAVRAVIEGVQPILSLHGHIHESRAAVRIGRTLAINPGSSYEQGILHGAIVDVEGKAKVKRYKLTTG
jgi:Icc-related predicted phosphoesterase